MTEEIKEFVSTEEAIEHLIKSDDPVKQAYGRLLSTGIAEVLKDFINAEAGRGMDSYGSSICALSFLFSDVFCSVLMMMPEDGALKTHASLMKLLDERVKSFIKAANGKKVAT
jgi:hypothetical protein